MLRTPRALLVMFALAAGVSSFACGGGTTTDIPQQQVVTTSPSGLKVTAAISAASLGESYANVQLAFLAEAASNSAAVEVVSVSLVDATTGDVVDTLKATAPQVWIGNGYTPWDQRVTPGGDLKASYQLSAPSWSTIDQSDTKLKSTYSRTFKLLVTLRIDGVDVLMKSADLHREAQFQT
jgi:hypothetical protein